MKRILFIISLAVIALGASAQRGVLKTPAYDTLNGNEVVNLPVVTITGDVSVLSISALCTEIGGTSDGTLILQYANASDDYIQVTEKSELFEFLSNDTLTIVDGAIFNAILKNPPAGNYRLQGDGTVSDSTLVQPYYRYR